MIYAVSDIHGCFEEFKELLEKIDFSDGDELYVLGDIMDRGPEPIKLIQYMMLYPNIYPMLGNHDYMALKVLSRLNAEITKESIVGLTEDDIMNYLYWTHDGGEVTVEQFVELEQWVRKEILEYLGECSLYEDIYINGKRFTLVHAGINNFDERRKMDSYRPEELIFERADYGRKIFSDANRYLVTGHTPTFSIRNDKKNLVFEENGHIAIDCGCVYGGKLAAFCLDTGKCCYVDKK